MIHQSRWVTSCKARWAFTATAVIWMSMVGLSVSTYQGPVRHPRFQVWHYLILDLLRGLIGSQLSCPWPHVSFRISSLISGALSPELVTSTPLFCDPADYDECHKVRVSCTSRYARWTLSRNLPVINASRLHEAAVDLLLSSLRLPLLTKNASSSAGDRSYSAWHSDDHH